MPKLNLKGIREFVKNTLPIFTILKGLNMNNRR